MISSDRIHFKKNCEGRTLLNYALNIIKVITMSKRFDQIMTILVNEGVRRISQPEQQTKRIIYLPERQKEKTVIHNCPFPW